MALPAPTFREQGALTFSGSTLTKVGAGIGPADANRRVIVTLGRLLTAGRVISSVTIGGIAATVHFERLHANNAWVACASAVVPTGTTADIVVTLSNTVFSNGVYETYTVDNTLISLGNINTATASVALGASLTVNYTGAEGGFAIGATSFSNGTSKTPQTVAGYTIDYNNPSMMAFHLDPIAASGANSATTAWTGNFDAVSGVVAFAPSHDASGALVGGGATLAGTAQRNVTASHSASGALAGGGAALAGAANRTAAGVTITSISATTDGTNLIVSFHTSVDMSAGVAGFGYSIGSGEPITWWVDEPGAANNQYISVPLLALGIVAGDVVNIDAGYSLTNPAGSVVYASDESTPITTITVGVGAHYATGDLIAGGATMAGTAQRNSAGHTTVGDLVGSGAVVAGEAAIIRAHTSSGVLAGAGASVFGVATDPSIVSAGAVAHWPSLTSVVKGMQANSLTE